MMENGNRGKRMVLALFAMHLEQNTKVSLKKILRMGQESSSILMAINIKVSERMDLSMGKEYINIKIRRSFLGYERRIKR